MRLCVAHLNLSIQRWATSFGRVRDSSAIRCCPLWVCPTSQGALKNRPERQHTVKMQSYRLLEVYAYE